MLLLLETDAYFLLFGSLIIEETINEKIIKIMKVVSEIDSGFSSATYGAKTAAIRLNTLQML